VQNTKHFKRKLGYDKRRQIEPSLVDFCNLQPAHRPSLFRELYSVHEVTYKQTDLGNNITSAVTQQLLHVTK